jgi:small-conductance mechanosensitive channel
MRARTTAAITMLKRTASIFLLSVFANWSHAQAPAEDEPIAPLTSRAVMTGEQVIRILDETVDWYRLLGVQQQSATQPSDLLILYANRQTADRVVALAFEIARANAELLSSEAEMQQSESPDTESQVLQRSQQDLEARRAAIRAEVAQTERQVAAAQPPERDALQAKLAELSSELDLVNARRNLLSTMAEFAHESDANGSGVSALREHINAIAASIPASVSGVAPDAAAAAAAAPAAPVAVGATAAATAAEQGGASRFGIWDLGANVLRLTSKLATIDEVDRRTELLQATFTQIRAMPEQQIKALSARGDEIATLSDASGAAVLKTARDEYDTLAWLFAQTSSILVPLSKAGVLLEQYRNNLESWRASARAQYRSALKTLAARAGLLVAMLAVVFGASELWRRAVFNYVQEARRRHQLMLVRRIVVGAVAVAIVGIAFATEVGSLATFAGLLTAGIAVAMQSVLVSIVGYFFLVGKHGLRVGDRVQIGNVTGEVIDLGLVRLHLMELGPLYRPTGRIVAFANSVVFQASGGIFKQIPGVNLAWREITLAVPETTDYTAVKDRLRAAADEVLEDYREELVRQTRELQKTAASNPAEEAQAHVRLRFSSGSVEATVRYPVPFHRAAEVEERMSRALLDAMRDGAVDLARLTSQPA